MKLIGNNGSYYNLESAYKVDIQTGLKHQDGVEYAQITLYFPSSEHNTVTFESIRNSDDYILVYDFFFKHKPTSDI
ncbi:MAG: hypothetical protein NT085_02585 [candidate division SR1 bacterium]|nr:hypothetical protein [candidate division SR1 bacterium]